MLKEQKVHEYQAESVVIGSLLLEPNLIEDVLGILSPLDFYDGFLRSCFNSIVSLYSDNQPFDIITISNQLSSNGVEDSAQQLAYLAENSISLSNIKSYCQIVKDYSRKRSLLTLSQKINNVCLSSDEPIKQSIQLIGDELDKLTSIDDISNKTTTSEDTVKEAIQILYELSEGKNRALQTSFPQYNDMTGGGIQLNDLTIIAGRPSMGKTTLALNMLLSVAIISEAPVLVFTLEMSKHELMLKLFSILSGISGNKMRTAELDQREVNIVSKTAEEVSKLPLYFNDKGSITINEIQAISKKYKRQKDIKLIVIDYLQLINTNEFGADQRVGEISHITRSLKILARELKVGIVLLSQLNRQAENRLDKKPQLSDLRDSGAIEQDADNVLLIYRPEVYKKTASNAGIAEVIISKQRNGAIGSFELEFDGACSKFTDKGKGKGNEK